MHILGNLNAKIGQKDRKFGRRICTVLRERNERDDIFEWFVEKYRMIICNIQFRQHVRRLYTLRSPDGQVRN